MDNTSDTDTILMCLVSSPVPSPEVSNDQPAYHESNSQPSKAFQFWPRVSIQRVKRRYSFSASMYKMYSRKYETQELKNLVSWRMPAENQLPVVKSLLKLNSVHPLLAQQYALYRVETIFPHCRSRLIFLPSVQVRASSARTIRCPSKPYAQTATSIPHNAAAP